MDGATQTSICPHCGSSAEPGFLFCKNCGATLRPVTPLVSSVAPEIKLKLAIWKRILRGLVKTIAAVAGLVIIFDNRASELGGIVLIASVAVVLLCFLGWRAFDLGKDDVFWPKKADS